MTDAWFSPEAARLFSFLSLFSLCSLFAIPARKGQLRGLAVGVWNAVIGLGVLLLGAGAVAASTRQPWHVTYALLLSGFVVGLHVCPDAARPAFAATKRPRCDAPSRPTSSAGCLTCRERGPAAAPYDSLAVGADDRGRRRRRVARLPRGVVVSRVPDGAGVRSVGRRALLPERPAGSGLRRGRAGRRWCRRCAAAARATPPAPPHPTLTTPL